LICSKIVPEASCRIEQPQRAALHRVVWMSANEIGSGAPRGPGVAAMKCQSYQYIPCFENTAQAIARLGFVHGLVHDAS
jgi:hypothetical protein